MTILTILETVNWSRLQFALTAMYHWIFVPLTLGLGFICAIMETIYYRSGDENWKKITKFWMKLFAINFAVGVATGIILEFEFGTNWSNYSYFVGDIFGAPLAIEGMIAFFMEATFMAVMYFGWERVSKKFHLISTWGVAIGANISAIWILIANSWMQYPVGMEFNIETMRNEMTNFSELVFNPVAINKIFHTVTSGFLLAAIFVVGISSWYLLKDKYKVFAKRSIRVASIFGLISVILVLSTGDKSAYLVAKKQPMKFAAMEALMDGGHELPLTVIGFVNADLVQEQNIKSNDQAVSFAIDMPNMLSYLATRGDGSYIPGVNDLVHGNNEEGIISATEKINRGKFALSKMKEYGVAKESGDLEKVEEIKSLFDYRTVEGKEFVDKYFKYFGYGYFDSPIEIVPNIAIVFYAFRIMVGVGVLLIAIFIFMLYFSYKDKLEKHPWLLILSFVSIPFTYIASQCGWIVAEVGRQPWTVQDMLPTIASVSDISSSAVKTTFFIFVALFSVLLIAEVGIMIKQINKGPQELEL